MSTNAYEYLRRLIEDGYFDDAESSGPTGLRRLLAATGALLHAESPSELILPEQQDELVRFWKERQSRNADINLEV
jgi:hypothetical protein